MVPLAPPPPPPATTPLPAPAGQHGGAGAGAAASAPGPQRGQEGSTRKRAQGQEGQPPLIPALLTEPGREVGFEETWYDRSEVQQAMERAASKRVRNGSNSGVPVPGPDTLMTFKYELDDWKYAVCPGLRIALPGSVTAARTAGARALCPARKRGRCSRPNREACDRLPWAALLASRGSRGSACVCLLLCHGRRHRRHRCARALRRAAQPGPGAARGAAGAGARGGGRGEAVGAFRTEGGDGFQVDPRASCAPCLRSLCSGSGWRSCTRRIPRMMTCA